MILEPQGLGLSGRQHGEPPTRPREHRGSQFSVSVAFPKYHPSPVVAKLW